MRRLYLFLFIFLSVTYFYADILEVGEGYEYSDLGSAVSRAMRGDTVIVHEGEYYSEEAVTIFSKHWIDITTSGEVILISGNSDEPVLKVIRSDNISIEGFRFEHRSQTQGTTYSALISNCYFITLRDSELAYNSIGVRIYDGRTVVLSNNYIHDFSGSALEFGGIYTGTLISNNVFEDTSQFAVVDEIIKLNNQSSLIDGIVFKNNQIDLGQAGLAPTFDPSSDHLPVFTNEIVEQVPPEDLITETVDTNEFTNSTIAELYDGLPYTPRYRLAVYEYEKFGFELTDELNKYNGFLDDYYMMDEPRSDIFEGSYTETDSEDNELPDDWDGYEWEIVIPRRERGRR